MYTNTKLPILPILRNYEKLELVTEYQKNSISKWHYLSSATFMFSRICIRFDISDELATFN